MKSNILKALSKNLGFKILALLFAFTLWLTVYNIEDPTKSKTLTVNVNISNKEYIDSLGKYFEIKDGTNKVSFSVTAARSLLDKLDESDFTATANMEQIVLTEDGTEGLVPIEVVCNANINSNSIRLSSTNKSLKLALEDLMTKQFVVTASAFGEVAQGYALGNVEVTAPNVLKISGPKSIVEDIASVIATIDVSGMSESWTTYKASPILFNAEGKEIDTTRLTFSDNTVNVSAEILSVKDVAISVQPSGAPASGYEITSVSINPTTIRLKGDKSVLNTINVIEIPASVISVSGADKNVSATIDVTEYIPYGATLVDAQDAVIEIMITVGQKQEKSYNLETKNILVTGLPTGASFKFELESIAVKISGLEADIAMLNGSMLTGSIDVTGLNSGLHEVDLVLDIDANKYVYQPVKVKIAISESVETGTTVSPENTQVPENGTDEENGENVSGSQDSQTEN